ncbi:hypothetical protein ACFWQL_13450 [Amycolatopsis thermoflava]|uniref:hypothetical protein n=1 Tax=Amycolatopsis thermoflava TaxID=84480 RepID=UPI00365184F3
MLRRARLVLGVPRAFAPGWAARGVDHELVDAQALRDGWLSARPPAPSMTLLQQAWLATAR